MPIGPGQHLLHYRLIEKIGEGGMGVVWKADDTKLHRYVALKLLPAAMATDPDRRARFEREARAVAALNHPNIVTLHSVEEASTPDGTVHFLTMELVTGETLSELLPKDGFPLRRLLEIAIPLADAVAYAHRAGITHRDLKPDNVMIDAEGRLRVLDFGLVKLQALAGSIGETQAQTMTSDTAEGRVLGTVSYMSPEQAEGKGVDPRSDVFSLGTILYEMASGERPFRGDTPMSTISSILKDEPSPITELKRSLPRHTGRIVRRCLAKDPDRRYQTALELRNELEELKAEVESGMHAVGPVDDETSPRRSRVPVLIGAVAVMAMVAIAAILAIQRWEGKGSPTTRFLPTPITATSAWDADPVWSPDGKRIAFVRMESGNSDIYVKPIDGGQAVVRVGGPGDQDAPRWTPDGSYLAYVSQHKPGSPLFLVPSDGGTPRELIATNIPTLEFGGVPMGDRPWSSDGETLLVSMPTESQRLAVHRVERASGRAEQITFPPAGSDDSYATYSFDGKQILFRRSIEGKGALMLMAAEGGDPEILLRDEFSYDGMAWRPDNRRIVVEAARGTAVNNLFEIDVVTRKIIPLTAGTLSTNGVSVSMDDRVLFSSFWHDQFLYRVDVETGEQVQLTSHARDNRYARVSPDGRIIAYASNRTGNSEIWLHYLDGRPESRLTDDEGEDAKPEWSPDGRRIVFVSDREDGAFKLFVTNADGGTEPRLLTDRATNWGRGGSSLLANNPVSWWSPDGEIIAYRVIGDAGPELWTVGSDGVGARTRLDGVTGFDWYRGSRWALITRRSGTEEKLLAIDLDTGQEQTLFAGALQQFDVAPDGSAVAFSYGPGHLAMGLAVLELEEPADVGGLPRAVGEPRYVVPTEGTWHVHNGGWSPDSKSLVYTQDRDYGHIYELSERR
ncbi:MAG: serine/threonine-protein kinase [Acidobacteriota bacterium]|nr:MAG: serine/threonine-protein kinase [Acidobacteriota bacterium]